MILADSEVEKLMDDEKIIIDPRPNPKQWQGMTVDFSLGDKFYGIDDAGGGGAGIYIDLRRYNVAKFADEFWLDLRVDESGCYMLKPREFILVYTKEKLAISPESNICAFVQGKSSLARIGLGVHITAPTIHPGFGWDDLNGPMPIMLEIYNYSLNPILLPPGRDVCQIIFHRIEGRMENLKVRGLGKKQPRSA